MILFGPIVGYRLKELFHGAKNIEIVGDLNETVCDTNIEVVMKHIQKEYSNPFIIAIDSALSSEENVGKIIVSEGGICLGKGIGKSKVWIGDMSIKGVVAKNLGNPRHNLRLLQNVHLGFIMQMADVVANGIYNSIEFEG